MFNQSENSVQSVQRIESFKLSVKSDLKSHKGGNLRRPASASIKELFMNDNSKITAERQTKIRSSVKKYIAAGMTAAVFALCTVIGAAGAGEPETVDLKQILSPQKQLQLRLRSLTSLLRILRFPRHLPLR